MDANDLARHARSGRMGITKKPAAMASPEFAALMAHASKAALIDALWCACQLGTDDSPDQILIQACRNLDAALQARGDRLPAKVAKAITGIADLKIDADPGA